VFQEGSPACAIDNVTNIFVDSTRSFVSDSGMPRPKLPRPTDAELAILRVLWRLGPSTVRRVQESMGGETGYTTVLKFLQIMTEKGLVRRDESERTHVYEASVPEEQTQRQLVKDLLDKAFNGSAKALVLQALSAKKASATDLAEIRRLLDEMERK
jgi:BlaI family transcriptional regulator, penicillinase repressor